MATVTFRNYTKRFGDTLVLKDIDLSVEDGEFVVFVGPSGSGKSTLLRTIAGLDEVTDGEILIGDRVVNDVAPKDRDIAMVFQSYALYPHMTVYDNMAYGLRKRKVDKDVIDDRIRSVAESLEISQLLGRRPNELSGGQRQRVAVGRAIVREPKAFLLDEPLSNLDAKLRVGARAFLSNLHEELGATFIYVTHDQIEAMTMGSRIAVLANNYLQQYDTPANLYNYPDNVFVAGFIGSPSMNFFSAKVRREEGQIMLDAHGFKVPAPESREHLLEDYVDKDVVVGIRPEDLHYPRYTPAEIEGHETEAKVVLVEMLGVEKVAYLRFDEDEEQFAARVDARSEIKEGETTRLVMDISQIHLFDAETEVAIRDDPPPSEHAQMIAEAQKKAVSEEEE